MTCANKLVVVMFKNRSRDVNFVEANRCAVPSLVVFSKLNFLSGRPDVITIEIGLRRHEFNE